MKRREFILAGGAAAGAAVMGPLDWNDPHQAGTASESLPVMPGMESFLSTTCLMCPGSCGLRVRLVDGIPVGIGGNPKHPVNAGGVCTDGVAALQLLYHPDRLLRPMRRTGSSRSNEFEEVSWEEALGDIARAMSRLREKQTPERLGFVLGGSRGSMMDLVEHFMTTWGSPNVFRDRAQDGRDLVFEVMHGIRARPAYDFNRASLVLSFGADLLNAWDSPVQFQRGFASFRDPSRGTPGSLIVADVRFSHTASRAREWVAVRPGSFGALALGIAYVMLREKLYDAEFAEQHLFGFEDLRGSDGESRSGYQSLVLRNYSPEAVSRLTGVPVEQILALGKTFGESPGAVALFDENVTAQPGGLYAAMAIHSLNLLKGNLNRPGGIYMKPRIPLAPLSGSQAGQNGIKPSRIVEDLVGMEEMPEILFLYHSNPLFSSPFRGRLEQALAKVPLVVSFSPFLDETCSHVDLLLPDALFLERWEDRFFPDSSPAAGWGVVQPCMPPAGETRPAGEVLLQLARIFGPPLEHALPWETFEDLLKHRAEGLFEAQAGSPLVDPFEQGLVTEIERRGWWMSASASFEEFWQRLLETGGWTDGNYQVRTLRDYSGNPDGRVDLYSRALEQRLSEAGARPGEADCLPHHVPGPGETETDRYPLVLNPYRLGKLGAGTSGILPWILQGAGHMQGMAWNSWAEIHPADAEAHEIKNRDWIWVESASGKLRVRALIYAGTQRGTVNIPYGLGHKAMGRWAQGRGVNPIELLAGTRDLLSGLPERFSTRVKVYKA